MEDGPGFCMGEGIREVIRGIEMAKDEPVIRAPEKVPAIPAFCQDPAGNAVFTDIPARDIHTPLARSPWHGPWILPVPAEWRSILFR